MAAKEVATTAVQKEVPTASDRSKSHPYFTQKVRLHSFHAQQVFDRGFDLCTTAIFSLSVVLRIIGTDDQARDVEGIVDEPRRPLQIPPSVARSNSSSRE